MGFEPRAGNTQPVDDAALAAHQQYPPDCDQTDFTPSNQESRFGDYLRPLLVILRGRDLVSLILL